MLLWLVPSLASAAPSELAGRWYRAPDGFLYRGGSHLATAQLSAVPGPKLTGGQYWYQAAFDVDRAGRYVIDFKNTTVIGQFRHRLFDAHGVRVADESGGIQSEVENPFPLRHGRDVWLAKGHYRLISEVSSPFFLAPPDLFVDDLEHYRQAIKPGNALTLLCLGLFIGLGLYYAVLAIVRRRMADSMYALFILGNLLYNGSALLVYPDLLGMHWVYLVSLPILFSNAAYVLFVLALLEIGPRTHPRLFKTGLGILGLFGGFVLLAALLPNWSLELDRYGVGIFATFGLIAATHRAREGNSTARWYLVAIAAFFVLGLLAISLSRVNAYTLCVEHVGLFAVAVEVSLLALVLAHQVALLHSEKEQAVHRASQSIRIAYTDALTGLPNRYRLEAQIPSLPSHGSLTFIDLDGLKHYNDCYGHRRGDELLCTFAQQLSNQLSGQAALYRLGGDEFAITCPAGNLAFIEAALNQAMIGLRRGGFEFAGASFGSVHVHESPSREGLTDMADTRMYEQKGRRRAALA
jgi:diguanylate cyclase (GGDEF)-like protein